MLINANRRLSAKADERRPASIATKSVRPSASTVAVSVTRTLMVCPPPSSIPISPGAVEKVLVRDDWRVRVGLAGPGRAFGYESLSGRRAGRAGRRSWPRPARASREGRREAFDVLFNGEDAVSRGLLDVIQRDLMATLRETFRPCARLAASI